MKLSRYALLGALLCTNPVLASGFYAGGSLGMSSLNCTGCDLSDGGGGKLFVGYHFTPYLGVEGGYAYLTSSIAGYEATAKQTSAYAAVTGTLPLNAKVGLFGKLGTADNRSRFNASLTNGQVYSWNGTSKVAPYWAAGLEFYVEPDTTVSLGYDHFSNEATDTFQANLVSFSFAINF